MNAIQGSFAELLLSSSGILVVAMFKSFCSATFLFHVSTQVISIIRIRKCDMKYETGVHERLLKLISFE